MMTNNSILRIESIKTYFYDEVNDLERAKLIFDVETARKNKIADVVVERLPSGEYILIEDFKYFAARLKLNPSSSILCLIRPSTNEKQRLLYILKNAIAAINKSSWLFKNEHVMRLIQNHNMSVDKIAHCLKVEPAQINKYVLDSRIPKHIREPAIKMKARMVVEHVCKSRIFSAEAKSILYERAILNKGNIYRLNSDKLNYMKLFWHANNTILNHLLADKVKLEWLIDKLLSSNFELEEHLTTLLYSYLNDYEQQGIEIIYRESRIEDKSILYQMYKSENNDEYHKFID